MNSKLRNIKNIINGHIKEIINDEEELLERRLKICRICPLYTDKLGGICDKEKYYDFVLDKHCRPDDSDTCIHGCGCRMQAKGRLPYANCVANKW